VGQRAAHFLAGHSFSDAAYWRAAAHRLVADSSPEGFSVTPLDQALADAKARFAYADNEESQWYWAEKVVWLKLERGDYEMIQGKPDQAAIEVLVKAMMEGK
jgi:hypothetical protein